jgi:hypothetical protein
MDSAPGSFTQPPAGEPAQPLVVERETTLFQAGGVLVTSQRLVTEGRTWLLGEIEGVNTLHRAPRVLPLLVILVLGVVLGLPLLHSAMAAPFSQGREIYSVALGGAALAIFGSIAGLLVIEDTYWLVLRTRQCERRVFRSGDHQLVSSLAAAVATAVARQRH